MLLLGSGARADDGSLGDVSRASSLLMLVWLVLAQFAYADDAGGGDDAEDLIALADAGGATEVCPCRGRFVGVIPGIVDCCGKFSILSFLSRLLKLLKLLLLKLSSKIWFWRFSLSSKNFAVLTIAPADGPITSKTFAASVFASETGIEIKYRTKIRTSETMFTQRFG